MAYTPKHRTNFPLLQVLRHLKHVTIGRGRVAARCTLWAAKPESIPRPGWRDSAPESAVEQARRTHTSAMQYLGIIEVMRAFLRSHDGLHAEHPARECPDCDLALAVEIALRKEKQYEDC